jgi:lantibiotic modifying enzyme
MGLLPAVLDGLVWLTGSEGSTPRWMTPSEYQVDERLLDLFPGGALNCGLAHGIPGPLAALSTAMSLGSRVAGHAAAVRSAAQWLADRRFEDAWGLNWPSAVAAYPDASTSAWDAMPSRASWCYGAPGVARSLWLAGQALDDDGLRDTAVCAMSAVLGRPIHAWGIDSPAFCHGLSGVLQVVLRFAVDTGAPQFIEGASHLVDRLIGCYSPDRPLGFASPEPPDNTLVDRPGLLEGAPGVVLALLAAATDIEPSWDRLFLLS